MAHRTFRQNCFSIECGPLRFLSRRESGNVNTNIHSDQFMRNRTTIAKNLYRREFKAHFGCVNAIEFSYRGGQLLASGIKFPVIKGDNKVFG